MYWKKLILTSIGNLGRNRLRTALSLVGVVIGVFSVTVIVSLGYGLRGYIINYLESFGRTVMAVNAATPGLSSQSPFAAISSTLTATSLKEKDYDALRNKQRFPNFVAVAGSRTGQMAVTYGNKDVRSLILATSSTYLQVDGQAKVAKGRFFTDSEDASLQPVTVLGSSVAKTLFGDTNPIGKKVRVGNAIMTVIGVMKSRGAVASFDFDTMAFVPLKFGLRRLIGGNYVNEIDIKVANESDIPQAQADVTRFMRQQHGIKDPSKDDFRVTTSTEVIERVATVTGTLTILLGLLAAISLLVGGIGIMNIMLVSVTERIREVGLRKALGASDKEMRNQYLTEAVVLTAGGGMLGGLLGIVVTTVAIFVARNAGYDVPYVLSLSSLLIALGVSVVVGLVFGAYPARKAAKLDAIEALRYE